MMPVVSGLVLCALACTVRADFLPGTYTYKLVLRDDDGFALSGAMSQGGDERVSANYVVEVYDADGVKVNATLDDTAIGRERGHNCTLSVPVGEGAGYAKSGERLTLVVTDRNFGAERFRSSKVLPPVGGMFGFAEVSAGVFYADATDTDNGWGVWRAAVEYYLPDNLGEPDGDYDGDGLSNMREYQLGTDPAGGALGLVNKPEFSIVETDGVYKVSFAYGWGHVYSIRAIEGTAAVGVDGQDLALYESLENLSLVSSLLSLCGSGSSLSVGSSADSFLSLSSSLQLSSILSNNLHGDLNGHLLVEVYESHIVTNLLGILHGDDLTINLLTKLLELISHLSGTYRTVELTGSAYLCGNLKSYTSKLGSLLLSSSLLSSQLVSLLLQVLCKDLLG